MVRNNQVAQAWKRGESAQSGRMSTDGLSVMSYGLRVGYTTPEGRKVALAYRGKHMRSMTTSHHVGLVMAVADETRNPMKDDE
mgnify:CR=1 FL=1